MDADRALRRDEVLFVGRNIGPDDKCLCKTHNVAGDTYRVKQKATRINRGYRYRPSL